MGYAYRGNVPYHVQMKRALAKFRKDVIKNPKFRCNKCIYGVRDINNSYPSGTCNYILVTGHRRQSDPLNCDKFKEGEAAWKDEN